MKIISRIILAFVLIAGIAPAIAQVPPPVPGLPDTERRTTYSITSSTCACAVNFAIYGDSTDYANWLEVFVNEVMIPASGNWTITSPTGPLASIPRPITDAVLTFTSAQTGTVQIVGARRPRRTSQFNENTGVSARAFNQALTDIVAQNRETWDKINDVTGRAVLAAPGETLALLPPTASRANMGACFDPSGNLTSCVSVPSSSFSAGSGIIFTGTNPTVISANTPQLPYTSPLAGGITQTVQTKLQQTVNALDLGVKCDGSTDDTAKMLAAASSATAAGATLVLPPGTCLVTALGPIPAGAHIQGQGIFQTYLQETNATATMFGISNANVTISDMSITSSVTRNSGAITFDMSQAGNAYFSNLTVTAHGTVFKTEAAGSTAVQFQIDKVLIGSTVANGVDFDLAQCFICVVSNTNAFHNPAARPFAEFVLRNVPGQLQLINDNLDQAGIGINAIPGSGQVVTLVKAELTYLDSNPNGALVCGASGTGIIQRMIFHNGWMTGGGGLAVNCAGGGSTALDQLSFDNIEFVGGSTGNIIDITSASSVSIINSRFGPIGASSADISLSSVQNCNVTGNTLQGFQGVNLSGNTTYCDVHDNMSAFATTPVVSSASPGTGNRTSNP